MTKMAVITQAQLDELTSLLEEGVLILDAYSAQVAKRSRDWMQDSPTSVCTAHTATIAPITWTISIDGRSWQISAKSGKK